LSVAQNKKPLFYESNVATVPLSWQQASPPAFSEFHSYVVPSQEDKSVTGGTQLPRPSSISTGVYQTNHRNADGTGATNIGPAPTHVNPGAGSTVLGHLRQPTQLPQPLSLFSNISSLAFGHVVPNTNSYSVSQFTDGSESSSWRDTKFRPYEVHQQRTKSNAGQVELSQGIPYGSTREVATTGRTSAQGHNIPITQSKEIPDSCLPSDRRSVLQIPATSTMQGTERLSVELGAHSRSAAGLGQAFTSQSPSGRKQPSSTERVDVTAGPLGAHEGLSMIFTPKPSFVGQSEAKPLIDLSLLETASGSLHITPPAANAYVFLKDRVASRSTAIVGTLSAEYSINIATDVDKPAQTDFFVQQGRLTTPQLQSLQRLTTAHIQQLHIAATTSTHRSYLDSIGSLASDQPDKRMSGRAVGVLIGAVAGGTCGFLAIFLIAVRHQKRKRRRIWISNQFWKDPNRSYISFGST
jgi:hypothetical protein